MIVFAMYATRRVYKKFVGRAFCLIMRVKVFRDSGTDHVIFNDK